MNRLGNPPYLCLVTPGKATPLNFDTETSGLIETVHLAAAQGISMIQVREKNLPARMLFELTHAIVKAVAGSDARVLVNGRADIAVAAGAHGVHLPVNSAPLAAIRKVFGREVVVGVSTHALDEVLAARDAGADYVYFGPVFPTPEKPAPVGLDGLKQVCAAAGEFPVIAIGGVDQHNIADVIKAGAAGAAAIRALNDGKSRTVILEQSKILRPAVR